VDTTKCAHATVHVRDCAGNITTMPPLTFTKGAKPVVTSTKTVLCSDADAIDLDAGGNFASYLWTTGETTKKITVKTPGTYAVTVDDGVGCSATSDPITITKSSAISDVIPAGPLSLCEPDSIQLNADAG